MGTRRADLFLATLDVLIEAISGADVAAAWDEPSVLEDQTIGSLAGHLARGGGWVVGDYLDGGEPEGPLTFESAAAYYAAILGGASEELHQGIRARGAALAAEGQAALVAQARERAAAIGPRLRSLDGDRRIAVIGGVVLRLDDYLETRIVEQVAHLDDLARSLGREPYAVPDEATAVALDVAVGVARTLHGDAAVVRGLYRRGFADAVFPVL